MCKFDNGLKLCTCEVSESDAKQEGYLWELRLREKIDAFEQLVGRFPIPSEDIGEGLVHEWVELNLNCEDCFDFDYQPADGDNLTIYKSTDDLYRPFLAFMYQDGLWCEGYYDEHRENHKPELQGKVESL